ncbi:unnamed protein product [Ceratitis capitata]|uniref:(Mediterranean fruit fly) hypothetical protein n=1 Tax=Ceratitis capitata TaxID=7213 RepID=A0A811UY32_CERCA|nr:unnamed protein product [Ceratitis capitata]
MTMNDWDKRQHTDRNGEKNGQKLRAQRNKNDSKVAKDKETSEMRQVKHVIAPHKGRGARATAESAVSRPARPQAKQQFVAIYTQPRKFQQKKFEVKTASHMSRQQVEAKIDDIVAALLSDNGNGAASNIGSGRPTASNAIDNAAIAIISGATPSTYSSPQAASIDLAKTLENATEVAASYSFSTSPPPPPPPAPPALPTLPTPPTLQATVSVVVCVHQAFCVWI